MNNCDEKKKKMFAYYFRVPWKIWKWKTYPRCSLLLNNPVFELWYINVMNYNCDNIVLDGEPVVSNVLLSWINGSFFQPSHFKVYRAFAWFTVKMPHLLFEKCVHIYTTQSTTRQSEANWNRWPLLNHITGDHISFFIGHKWSTSVSTWLSFHTKHLNRDSSPISVAPLCLNQHVSLT